MRGYWHIVAFSVTTALLFQLFQSKWFIICHFIWLLCLYLTKRCPLFPVCVATVLFIIVSSPYIDVVKETGHKTVNQNNHIKLTGEIVSAVERDVKSIQFKFQPVKTDLPFQAIYFPKNEEELKGESITQLKHGADCVVEGKYEQASIATNPGQFNFKEYLDKQNVQGQFIISSSESITCVGSSSLQKLYDIRQNILARATEKIQSSTSIWLKALIIGDTRDLPESTVKVFERWGLSHILAISGLHVGLLISIMYLILVKSNFLTKQNAEWFLIVFLPVYAVIAGGAPSVWRSSLMAFVVLILAKLKVKLIATDIVSIVFIALLVIEPNMILQIGFQFSFLVSSALIISRKWIMEDTSPFIQLLRISFLSQMVIVPIQVLYFHQIQPLSILLNVFVVPYFSVFVIPLLFIVLFLIWFPNPLVGIMDYIFVTIHEQFLFFFFFFFFFFVGYNSKETSVPKGQLFCWINFC